MKITVYHLSKRVPRFYGLSGCDVIKRRAFICDTPYIDSTKGERLVSGLQVQDDNGSFIPSFCDLAAWESMGWVVNHTYSVGSERR